MKGVKTWDIRLKSSSSDRMTHSRWTLNISVVMKRKTTSKSLVANPPVSLFSRRTEQERVAVLSTTYPSHWLWSMYAWFLKTVALIELPSQSIRQYPDCIGISHPEFDGCVIFCYIFHKAVMATKGQWDFLSCPACLLSRWSHSVPLVIKCNCPY